MNNKHKLLNSMIVLAAAVSSGCSSTANGGPLKGTAFLVSLFDRSITADKPEIKDRYLADFKKLVASLHPGDVIVADAITENPTATMLFPVQVVLPVYDPARDNRRLYDRKMESAKRRLVEQVEQLVRGTPGTQNTAILDALYVTRKMLKSELSKSASRRVIVVFSDMVEDSARANFELEQLSPARIKGLLATEEKNKRLPDLKDVDLWVAGATPDRRMDERRIRAIEAFWETYAVRCGTVLMPEHYGPALLDFNLDRTHGGTPK